jgi:hypothetical protein
MTVNTEDEELGKPTPEIKSMKPPQHGGNRPGSGRNKGTPNIMTRELKEICRQEAPILVKELIRLATGAESEAVRVAAIKEMFARGFGKAAQPIEGSMTYGVNEQLGELFRENVNGTLGSEIARRAALPPPNGEKPH